MHRDSSWGWGGAYATWPDVNVLIQNWGRAPGLILRLKRSDIDVATSKSPAFRLLYSTRTLEAFNRFTVQMQEAPDHWVKELSFPSEWPACLTARAKSKAKMCRYRVVDGATDEVVSTVRRGKTLIK